MSGRIMHSEKGELTYQAYGKKDEAIYSVSRGNLNAIMMNLAEKKGNSEIHYQHQCIDADLKNGKITLKNLKTNEIFEDKADVVFAADGAYSAIRYNSMQKVDRFNFSQFYVEEDIKNYYYPLDQWENTKLKKCSSYLAKRKIYVIALPNEDGSFTCTLFMPFENHKYAFNNLDSDKKIDTFLKMVFPDFYNLMPNLINNWHRIHCHQCQLQDAILGQLENLLFLGILHILRYLLWSGYECRIWRLFVMWNLYKKYEIGKRRLKNFRLQKA